MDSNEEPVHIWPMLLRKDWEFSCITTTPTLVAFNWLTNAHMNPHLSVQYASLHGLLTITGWKQSQGKVWVSLTSPKKKETILVSDSLNSAVDSTLYGYKPLYTVSVPTIYYGYKCSNPCVH